VAKEISFSSYNPDHVVDTLGRVFKSKVVSNGAEMTVKVPASFGDGFIGGIDFKDGLAMLVFNCRFKEDIVLKYDSAAFQPLRLIFCVENEFIHAIKDDRIQYQINYLLGSMVSGTRRNEQVFHLPAEKQIYYYSIEIDRKRYNQKIGKTILNSLPDELKEVFSDVESQRAFLYQSNYSLSIAECIQNIRQTEHSGLVRRVFIESQTLEILAMHIKQYMDDLEPSKKQSILRKKDIELIIAARNSLVANLINPPTIKELARLTATNEDKLKKGFRHLYNTSINKLLQDQRLSKAKLLIAEKQYPIKTIAEMVGYKHAGHFTSKFKTKYGVLPKDYLKTIEWE
jgi:AraC family transcriptional activator of pyochelin receptor